MKKRLMITGLLTGVLVATMMPGMASAKDKPKASCKNGGWEQLVDADGQPFTSQADCVGFANGGGTPVPPAPPLPDGVFAIAYANLDGAPGFGPGDVLIARWVDENQNGVPDAGDVVEMGRYPLTFTPSAQAPGDWGTFGLTSHVVDREVRTEVSPGGTFLSGTDAAGARFGFATQSPSESYGEANYDPAEKREVHTGFTDGLLASAPANRILVHPHTGSRPSEGAELELVENVDDGDSVFIDVDIVDLSSF